MRTDEQIIAKINSTTYTAGVDEAGAGALCGNLVVAAVVLDPKKPIYGLNDSKKLTNKKREILYYEIIKKALDYSIIYITPNEIDNMNIFQARMEGFRRAVAALRHVEYAVFDGNKIPDGISVESDCMVKGDAKLAVISAASILAKVSRDKQIIEQAKIHPEYLLEKHKGYSTKTHLEMLAKFGPIKDFHRLSYSPVKNNINNLLF